MTAPAPELCHYPGCLDHATRRVDGARVCQAHVRWAFDRTTEDLAPPPRRRRSQP